VWITLDDHEHAYGKVLCDQVFGRANFLGNVIWEKADSPRMDAEFFSTRHDNILVYARDRSSVALNRISMGDDIPEHYNKIDEMGRRYYLKPLRAMSSRDDTRQARPSMYYGIVAPDGEEVFPRKPDGMDGRWRWGRDKYEAEQRRVEWITGRSGWVPYYRIYADTAPSRPPETLWPHGEAGSNRTAMAEQKALSDGREPFSTPKPEALLQRVLRIATDGGDLVLDSFAGSGTTGAVAHKMGRRWIMVELGEHCHTHIIPRLKQVIDGSDQGGISKAVDWHGGGGFRYYRLAPSLLERDRYGNLVINPRYNAEMLAEAMCKHEGFTYAPSRDVYWQHGQSTERDFIYVTTQTLTREQLAALSEEVGLERSLLVCCAAWIGDADEWPNLSLKKIPNAVEKRCEWGRDDYSLRIEALPVAEREPEPEASPAERGNGRGARERVAAQPTLFAQGGEA
jgi:adenine-specific DNA-methyltransferase